jgi:hypothetical protein
VFKIKEDIENKARRKKPQPKSCTFTGHNHDRINVAVNICVYFWI